MSRTRDLRQLTQPNAIQFPSSQPGPTNLLSEPDRNDELSARAPQSARPSKSPAERPLRPQASHDTLGGRAPSRPQRNAARQPGIVVSNDPSEVYRGTTPEYPSQSRSASSSNPDRYAKSRGTPDYSPRQAIPPRGEVSAGPRDRLGNTNKLYQAVSGRRNEQGDDFYPDPSQLDQNANGYLKEDYRTRRDQSEAYGDRDPSADRRRSRTSSDGSYDPDRNVDLLTENDLKGVRQNHGARVVAKVFADSVMRPENARRPPQRLPPGSDGDPGRSRRPAVADQGFHAKPSKLDDRSYPMTPGFREIEQVLVRIKTAWERTGITGDIDDDEGAAQGSSNHFSPVALALDLLESENAHDQSKSAKRAKDMINQKGGLVPSLSSFLKLKAELEKALQLTIQTNYRQFDASVNAYNLARMNVEHSTKRVIELKSRLTECRNTLGCGRNSSLTNSTVGGKGSEMKALQGRREMLGEMLKLIDMIDQLKQVPEKLETLISSKNFLSATVLLVRSLKLINKPELVEIGGLVDLRSYLVNQETTLFEILIEELHNHLYLKSYFCDNRWRVYRQGQSNLPVIQFLDGNSTDIEKFDMRIQSNSNTPAVSHTASFPPNNFLSSSQRRTKTHVTSSLQHFLDDLLTKPQSNPLLDEPDMFLEMNPTPTSPTLGDHATTSPVSHRLLSHGIDGKKRKTQNVNPEVNSFTYMESLIESLAVLGKLSLGLDNTLQRAPLEIYNLVEATIHEVEDRYESSTHIGGSAPKPYGNDGSINTLSSNRASTLEVKLLLSSAIQSFNPKRISSFKININEIKELESNSEILQDFFWTLFSKLDATLQSFRVTHEVGLRISQRKGFKEDGIKSTNVLFSLLEIWKSVQSEVRALLHDYLTDLGDTGFGSGPDVSRHNQGSSAATATRRNPIVSIAEVLRFNIGGSSTTATNIGAIWKDPNKQLFKFKDTDLKLNNKDLEQHESNLDFALKVSVPGLVIDQTTINNNVGGGILLTTGLLNDEAGSNRTGGSHGNGTHRLLAKPDAFHIVLLLKPTLEFLIRAKEVLPNGVVVSTGDDHRLVDTNDRHEPSGNDDTEEIELTGEVHNAHESINLLHFDGFNGFLDEFVLHTFLPQLEQKVARAFEQAINAPDAFQEDVHSSSGANTLERGSVSVKRKTIWQLPVAKSMITSMKLIESLCDMLNSMPFHREKHGRLIVSIVVQYYQKCHERFKELVSREATETIANIGESDPHANLKLAADWAQRPELNRTLQGLHDSLSVDSELKKMRKNQFQIEAKFLEDHEISLVDLIRSPKKITALCNLHSSLDCFVTFTRTLSSSIQIVASPEGEDHGEDVSLEPPPPNTDVKQRKSDFRLPLARGILKRFQIAQNSYQSLAQTILFTLHLELRLQAYHFLGKTSQEGQYFLTPSDSTEPDPNIIELNSILSSSEAALTSALSKPQRNFVLLGFGSHLNRLLINTVLRLKIGNEHGFRKMYKNVLALQQNMKTLKSEDEDEIQRLGDKDGQIQPVGKLEKVMNVNFERSRKFWEMASKGPDAVMSSIRNGASYSFEEYRRLLCLLCKINPSSTTGENVIPAETNGLLEDEIQLTNANHSPGFDRRKRVYNEFLIELHALVLDDDDDEED